MRSRTLRWMTLVALLAVTSSARADVKWSRILDQPEAWYATSDAAAVADAILQYQTHEGGWPKNVDMSAPPSADFLANDKFDHRAPTLDNEATSTQLVFLARVLTAADKPQLRESFFRGFDYVLAAQYPNGGWPQYFPLIPGYYCHVTFNDNAMVNLLNVLRDVAAGKAPYRFVDEARRDLARSAVDRGVDCILRCQVRQNGRLTVWCAQHDEKTLAPAWARNFEPPSLSGAESVGVVKFLMSLESPSPEICAAIESAVAWFTANEVRGLRVEDSMDSAGKKDRHAIPDPGARGLWARFYELRTDRPIFTGRDKVIRYDFNEIERERRAGYTYLGRWPATLLKKEFPRWRKAHPAL